MTRRPGSSYWGLLSTAFLLFLLPASAWALTYAQRLAVVQHPPVPSYVANFQGGNLPTGVAEARATTAWDYSTSVDGTTTPIVSFAATVPRWPTWSQRTPTAFLGLGAWATKANRCHMSSQTQTITVTSGAAWNVWLDSASGTVAGALTNALTGSVTANGWPGQFTGTTGSTSLVLTISGGSFTQCNVVASAFNSPPIVTTTANVTVGTDIPTVPIAGVTGYNPNVGTLVATFYPTTNLANGGIFSFDDGTSTNVIRANLNITTGTVSLVVVAGGVAKGNVTSSTAASFNSFNRVAMSWNTSGSCISLTGGPVATANISGLPGTAVTQAMLATEQAGATPLNGNLEKAVYYPRKMCHLMQQLSMIRH